MVNTNCRFHNKLKDFFLSKSSLTTTCFSYINLEKIQINRRQNGILYSSPIEFPKRDHYNHYSHISYGHNHALLNTQTHTHTQHIQKSTNHLLRFILGSLGHSSSKTLWDDSRGNIRNRLEEITSSMVLRGNCCICSAASHHRCKNAGNSCINKSFTRHNLTNLNF